MGSDGVASLQLSAVSDTGWSWPELFSPTTHYIVCLSLERGRVKLRITGARCGSSATVPSPFSHDLSLASLSLKVLGMC